MKFVPICTLILASAAAAFAQQRDFLTSNEIEKVREAQEPNDRLKLYVLFARQRMDQLEQAVTKEKKGRALNIRQLLEDYSNIIDAIDSVRDDALKRHWELKEGPGAVAGAERHFLDQLQKIKAGAASDIDAYEIELTEAIDATNDSLELGHSDMSNRARELITEDEKAKKADEAMVNAEDKGKPVPGAPGATASSTDPSKPARKPPTLMRPGEKPPDLNQ